MHSINIMILERGKPSFTRSNFQLSLEVNFCNCTFECHLEAKSSIYSIKKLLSSESILDFKIVWHY